MSGAGSIAMNPIPIHIRFEHLIALTHQAIGAHSRTIPGWMCRWMWIRVRSIGLRVGKLLEHLRAGTYRASRPRTRKPDPAKRKPHNPIPINIRSTVPEGSRLPTRFGWLTRLLPYNNQRVWGASCTAELEALLRDPEMEAQIRACPALARQFRPLCHLLGIPPPLFLKLPPRPPGSTPRKPRAPRQPRPVPPPPAPAPPPRPLPYAVVSSTDGPYPNPNLSICGLKNWPP